MRGCAGEAYLRVSNDDVVHAAVGEVAAVGGGAQMGGSSSLSGGSLGIFPVSGVYVFHFTNSGIREINKFYCLNF